MKEIHQALVVFCYYANYIAELEQNIDCAQFMIYEKIKNAWRKCMPMVISLLKMSS